MPQRLLNRLLDSGSSHYIAFVSMVQGVVVAYAVALLDLSNFDGARLFLLLATFIVTILVWDEYHSSSYLYKWVPRLRDSVIPFVVGLSELLMVKFAYDDGNLAGWFYSASMLCLSSLVAYYNMYERAKNATDICPLNGTIVEMISSTRMVKWFPLSLPQSLNVFLGASTLAFAIMGSVVTYGTRLRYSVLAFLMVSCYAWCTRSLKVLVIDYARQVANQSVQGTSAEAGRPGRLRASKFIE